MSPTKERTVNLKFDINLLGDGYVVTKDGEILGTWDTDESDSTYEFTPDGNDGPTLTSPYVKFLCDKIGAWHTEQSN